MLVLILRVMGVPFSHLVLLSSATEERVVQRGTMPGERCLSLTT